MAGHGAVFTVAGALTGAYAPSAVPALQQVVRVYGLTVTNTTVTAAAVLVRDGGSSGNVLAGGPIPAQAGGVPGVLDLNYAVARVALNGLYVEIDGGAATGVIWVL